MWEIFNVLLEHVVAPLLVGMLVALFTHWLSRRK